MSQATYPPGYPPQMVYRLHDEAGRIVYIGRSRDVARRLRGHYAKLTHPDDVPNRPTWLLDVRRVSMAGPFPWDEAVKREREEIEAHDPRGNVAHTSRDPRPRIGRMT